MNNNNLEIKKSRNILYQGFLFSILGLIFLMIYFHLLFTGLSLAQDSYFSKISNDISYKDDEIASLKFIFPTFFAGFLTLIIFFLNKKGLSHSDSDPNLNPFFYYFLTGGNIIISIGSILLYAGFTFGWLCTILYKYFNTHLTSIKSFINNEFDFRSFQLETLWLMVLLSCLILSLFLISHLRKLFSGKIKISND